MTVEKIRISKPLATAIEHLRNMGYSNEKFLEINKFGTTYGTSSNLEQVKEANVSVLAQALFLGYKTIDDRISISQTLAKSIEYLRSKGMDDESLLAILDYKPEAYMSKDFKVVAGSNHKELSSALSNGYKLLPSTKEEQLQELYLSMGFTNKDMNSGESPYQGVIREVLVILGVEVDGVNK
jgi:hypothetical protein